MNAATRFSLIALLASACWAAMSLADADRPASPPATSQPASRPDAVTTQPAAPAVRQIHAFITGRVQGVGFRDFTRANAQRLGLVGWVRNLGDGRVEIVAQGPADRIEKLLTIVRTGPSSARVSGVQVKDESIEQFTSFERLPTK